MIAVDQQAPSTALRKARFNLRLASYAHPSWVGSRLVAMDASDWRESRAVSRWLADEAGVAELFDWRMKERAKRLFLMDLAEVERVSLELGVARHRGWLSRQVHRETVLAQRNAFGEELLSFAFEHVPRGLLSAPKDPRLDGIVDPARSEE